MAGRPKPRQGAVEQRHRGASERCSARARVRRDRPGHRQAPHAPRGGRARTEGVEDGRADPRPAAGRGRRAPQSAHVGDGRPAARPLPRPIRRRARHTQALPRLRAQPHLPLPREDPGRAPGAETLDAFYAELRRCRKHCTTPRASTTARASRTSATTAAASTSAAHWAPPRSGTSTSSCPAPTRRPSAGAGWRLARSTRPSRPPRPRRTPTRRPRTRPPGSSPRRGPIPTGARSCGSR